MKKINVAVIGYGFSAKVFHLPFIQACEGYNLVAILQRSSSNSLKDFPEVPIVRNIDELLHLPALDLVVITSTNSTHFEYSKKALLAKKHVIVEKPFTTTLEQAVELTDLASRLNLVLAVYHNRRFDGDFKTVSSILEQNLLGQLLEFHSRFDRFRMQKKNPHAWREDPNQEGSGVLFDLGPHLIDQAVALFGVPNTVFARVSNQRMLENSSDDAFSLVLDYDIPSKTSSPGTLTVILSASMITRIKPPRFSLFGTNGSFVKYGLDVQEPTLISSSIPVNHPLFGIDPQENWGEVDTSIGSLHLQGKIETLPGTYISFYENVRDTINGTSSLIITPQHAISAIKIIDAAFKSAKLSAPVSIDQ
ncbi:hypothetical protein BB560_005689 [Smittium megazygosporum]|uniref:Oxidoreductase n=1 Tax=Smittium megazygosporum TaxID=133381 RepID=A0A2T9Z140_9FUNG|nr:hypothetical protein BB560_005689 [Smittium megazygosporum]